MQIREQGRQVQLIRSPYDSIKKRCVQKVVHTFEKQSFYQPDGMNKYLSAKQLSDLSDDEKKTLSDWLKAKADKKAADNRASSIRESDANLIALADAILADGVSAEQAAVIWESIEKLSKALKKAGHPKSSLKASGAPQTQPGPDLLSDVA